MMEALDKRSVHKFKNAAQKAGVRKNTTIHIKYSISADVVSTVFRMSGMITDGLTESIVRGMIENDRNKKKRKR